MSTDLQRSTPSIDDCNISKVPLHLDTAIDQFLAWELIAPEDVVNGGIAVSSLPRRNLNLRLERPRGPGLLIKQPDPAVPDSLSSLQNERQFYRFCHAEARAGAITPWLPRLVSSPWNQNILTIEWVEGAVPLAEHFWEARAGELSTSVACDLGRALAALHATFAQLELAADPRLAKLPCHLPPGLHLDRPRPSILRRMSAAQNRLLQMARDASSLHDGFAQARAGWQRSTVIHGDLRSDNVLVSRCDATTGAAARVWLVDWELVRCGDPAFDVGGALACFARSWLLGLPLEADLGPEQRVAAAEIPLIDFQPPIEALWRAYRESSRQTDDEAAGLLNRAIRYSGCILFQLAWEFSLESEHPSSLAILLLQLAVNLLANPARAAADLYGLQI